MGNFIYKYVSYGSRPQYIISTLDMHILVCKQYCIRITKGLKGFDIWNTWLSTQYILLYLPVHFNSFLSSSEPK